MRSSRMFRMADEFAFPKRVTKRRYSPQLFQAQSTDPKAWIAPVREELLDVYKRVNEAIAKCAGFISRVSSS